MAKLGHSPIALSWRGHVQDEAVVKNSMNWGETVNVRYAYMFESGMRFSRAPSHQTEPMPCCRLAIKQI